MDKLLLNIIEETFKSKKQQKYFYAKANDKTLSKKERNKWKKMASEFSDKTDFDEIPNEVDEIVDINGNISRKKIPLTRDSGGASKEITDKVVKTSAGSMGSHGVHGPRTSLRYWAESDMSKSIGFKKTMGKDADKKDAEKYFKKDLGLDDEDTEEKLSIYGYDDNLPDDKVRLVENPKKFIRDYVESFFKKKSNDYELVKKTNDESSEEEINPIIKKQIKVLKNTIEKNNINIKDVIKILSKEDE